MHEAPAWLLAIPVDRPFVLSMLGALVVAAVLRVLVGRTATGQKLIGWMHAAEAGFVAALLAFMLFFSFLQIILRNVANTGLLWVDPMLRQLLLWIGFTGAALATRLDRHINVDALSRILPPDANRIARLVTHAFAAFISILLANASLKMVREEAGAGTMSFLDIPIWCLQLIMPVALLVMGYRFLRHVVEPRRVDEAPPLLEGADHVTWILVLVAILALVGAPLFTVLGGITLAAFHFEHIDSSAVAVEMYRLAAEPLLIAVPMFTFAGYLLAESGAPRRLVRLSQALLGWMPGGLALVALCTCALFTAFTGGSGVTIIAIGGLLLPALLAERYPQRFTYGLLTTSGSLGLLFPPSLPIIIYGYVAAVSVDKLFAAGIIPGLLLVLILGLYSARVSIRAKVPRPRFSWSELRSAARAAAWEIPLPLLVVGGIYAGKVTVTEAASLTAAYALFVEVLAYRDVKLRDLPRILTESMVLVGGILIILTTALALSNYFITAEIPNRLFDWMQKYIHGKVAFLALLNVFLLIAGSLMDMFSAIVVVPLILPVAAGYGIDPVHLGIIFLTNLEIGYSTPPAGLNLFIASLRFRRPIVELYRASAPFILLYALVLLVITYVPQLSLWLVNLLGVR